MKRFFLISGSLIIFCFLVGYFYRCPPKKDPVREVNYFLKIYDSTEPIEKIYFEHRDLMDRIGTYISQKSDFFYEVNKYTHERKLKNPSSIDNWQKYFSEDEWREITTLFELTGLDYIQYGWNSKTYKLQISFNYQFYSDGTNYRSDYSYKYFPDTPNYYYDEAYKSEFNKINDHWYYWCY